LLAVTEACTNALLHGQSSEPDEPVPEVAWQIDGEAARFRVRDYSTQMWSKVSHPASGLTEGRDGGFGLGVMRELMDEVEIDVAPTGTTVSLVKRLDEGRRLSS